MSTFSPFAMKPLGYQINKSVRARGSANPGMYRTISTTTDRRKLTVSRWVKVGALSSNTIMLWQSYTNANNWTSCYFSTSSQFGYAQANGGVGSASVVSSAVFRDPSAWLHFVLHIDTANATQAERVKLWINNVAISLSASGAGWPTLNMDTFFNVSGAIQGWGYDAVSGWAAPSDGHHAEVHVVDGALVDPTAFGKVDALTGEWVPIRYAGTHGGVNGAFYDFRDASTTAALGTDYSGNGNTLTVSGFSVTSGVTFDQSTDTPTNNHCTWSPLKQSGSGLATLSAANLRFNGASGESVIGTVGITSGKWYWEVVYSTVGTTPDVGVIQLPGDMSSYPAGQKHYLYRSDGNKRSDGPGPVAYGATWTSNDVIGVAFDADAGSITFYKNNVSQGAAFSGIAASEYPLFPGASVNASTGDVNFGQRPFAYTPPTGFKALCAKNLSTPTIKRGDDAFFAGLRTGTGASASRSDMRFSPAFVWIKERSGTRDHNLFDTARGANKRLASSSPAAESSPTDTLMSFDANGFTLGADASANGVNVNTGSYVDWAWREGAAYGFDIVTYTGTGSNISLAHGLNAVPHFAIFKQRSGINRNWNIYHRSMGAGNVIYFTTGAQTANTVIFQNTTPTSSQFFIGSGASAQEINTASEAYIAYLWTSIPGFSLFGSYTGNGSADGTFVWCGFRPRFILIKNVTGATSWMIYDTVRNTFNPVDLRLAPNLSVAEAASGAIDVTANGFKLRANDANTNGGATNYIFAAFAEAPFKYATAR